MLRRSLLVLGVAAVASMAQAADVNVGMSISVGEPGFFGRLDIGTFPPPVLVYPAPIVVRPVPVARPPLYLHVPQYHDRYRGLGDKHDRDDDRGHGHGNGRGHGHDRD